MLEINLLDIAAGVILLFFLIRGLMRGLAREVGSVVGIIGGYLTGVVMLGINPGIFFYRMELNVEMLDVSGGFIKSLAFAVLVSIVSCYMGYYAHLRRDGVGPEAVSNAITSAVVMSCVLILCSDYVMTSLLM